jgi:alcohol dehydrogenase class IV
VFGRGTLEQATELLEPPYVVLTTTRAAEVAPGLIADAADVIHVGAGRVDELAGELRGAVRGELLVALGGGRVIDVAKALAAADPPRRVAAIPTTLSGAEMTAVHRHVPGVDPARTPRVRPALVINDPALAASQPAEERARSAANAFGHVAEGPLTPLSNPVARMAGLEAARLLADGFRAELGIEQRHDALALGALLAGYAISSTGYGLHHVASQTVARLTPIGHGAANAIMLPVTLGALRERFPRGYLEELDAAVGSGAGPGARANAIAFAVQLRDAGGLRRLRDGGVAEADLDQLASEAAARPELDLTPPAASEKELRELFGSAW